jgi:hypothetical protein
MQLSAWTKGWLSSVLCVMCLLGSEATAASAQEQLQGFVSQVRAATGQFSQYTVGTQGQLNQRKAGSLRFSAQVSLSGMWLSPMPSKSCLMDSNCFSLIRILIR